MLNVRSVFIKSLSNYWFVSNCKKGKRALVPSSVTRLGVLLLFGHLLKPLATIILPKLPTFLAIFVKVSKCFNFLVKSFWAFYIDIWRLFTGHTGPKSPLMASFLSRSYSAFFRCHLSSVKNFTAKLKSQKEVTNIIYDWSGTLGTSTLVGTNMPLVPTWSVL